MSAIIEPITWHPLPSGPMPDSEITVLVEFVHPDEPDADTWPGWWSGEHWIDAATGDRIERTGARVIAWADTPAGSRAC